MTDMTRDEKLALIEKAKEAYYTGNPIMGDAEYDELEKSAGLENASEIGSHSDSYTVRHPFMMGSLSKIQIKDNDGKDWNDYLAEIKKYIPKGPVEYTPKYDGVSFELIINNDGSFVSLSTRGDGLWGKDIYKHLKYQVNGFVESVYKKIYVPGNDDNIIIRGEVLVDVHDYNNHLKNLYVNTRAFVAGSLNQDEYQASDAYLRMVAYDFRTEFGKHLSPEYFAQFSNPDFIECIVPRKTYLIDADDFKKMYDEMSELRASFKYPLDGFVLKTDVASRSEAFDERPKDCVAVKFKPAVVETSIETIEWNLSPKTGEYFPVGIIKEVILDSKKVTRVSLHNYGYVVENNLGPGAVVKVSMAGDIIPFLYEVKYGAVEPFETPDDSLVDGVHLLKNRTDDEIRAAKFMASCDVLNIKGLGPKVAAQIHDAQPMTSHVFEFDFDVYASAVNTKTAVNLRDSFKKFVQSVSLAQIIESLAIPFCGERMSKECAKEILVPGSGDFTSMAYEGYSWVYEMVSENRYRVFELLAILDKYGYNTAHVTARPAETSSDKIKVILTGSPKDFGYATKADFLKAHPELEEAASMKHAAMLITDDLTKSSSKMAKARKLGVEIKTYGSI